MSPINVIIADRSPVVLSGFVRFFEKDARLNVIGQAHTTARLLALVMGTTNTVTIADWAFGLSESVEAASLVRQITQRTKLIFFATPERLPERRRALHLGARGFIGRNDSGRNAANIVARVAAGHIHVGEQMAEALLNLEFSERESRDPEGRRPTRREQELIGMVCRGMRNKEIASTLHIAEATVCHHLTSIYSKLQVSGRMALVLQAHKAGGGIDLAKRESSVDSHQMANELATEAENGKPPAVLSNGGAREALNGVRGEAQRPS